MEKTRESEEMYLETILLLTKSKAEVHSIDVAEELGYAKSSVSRGMNLLCQKGYLVMNGKGVLTLTPSGRKKAEDIYERHSVITDLLMYIGASRELAEEDACRIEHVVSPALFAQIKAFLQKTKDTNTDTVS